MMWGFGFGWLWMVLVWGLVIGAVVWSITRVAAGTDRGSDAFNPARRALDGRLARGEIDTEEYRRLRDELAG